MNQLLTQRAVNTDPMGKLEAEGIACGVLDEAKEYVKGGWMAAGVADGQERGVQNGEMRRDDKTN